MVRWEGGGEQHEPGDFIDKGFYGVDKLIPV